MIMLDSLVGKDILVENGSGVDSEPSQASENWGAIPMAKKGGTRTETKSEFLRKVLGKNPNLDYTQVNRRWAKAGHAGEISNPLYYKVRAELGIKTQWIWVREDDSRTKFPPAPATGEVYQFKVTLMDTKPPIWRRIQVGDCTLDKLHEHIQTAMGWTNSHLNHFRIDGKRYGDPMLMRETFEELGYADSTRVKLSEVLPVDGGRCRFEYEYDFGDGWLHEVLFEGRTSVEKGKHYPLCLEGARACPPDDVGGVWGYLDFLAAIADPENDQHEEMREWIGRKFDPEAFSALAATRRMKQGLPDWRSM
jgi:hypothetical protein